jgi:hypothetical protein
MKKRKQREFEAEYMRGKELHGDKILVPVDATNKVLREPNDLEIRCILGFKPRYWHILKQQHKDQHRL